MGAGLAGRPQSTSGGGSITPPVLVLSQDWAQVQRHRAPHQPLLPPEVNLSDFSFSIYFRDDDLLAGYDTTQCAGVLLPLFAAVRFPHPPIALFLT